MSLLSELFELQKKADDVGGAGSVRAAIKTRVMTQAGLPPPRTVTEEDLIEFHDYAKLRKRMLDKALAAVSSGFPVSNDRYTLHLKDIQVEGPETYSKKDVRDAILKGSSLSRKISGVYVLTDPQGNEIKRTARKTVLNVPYLTDHGAYIRGGIAYSLQNQLRMMPGVYTRVTSDGYPEAQFNAKPGTGGSFRTFLDDKDGVFYFKVENKKVPMYPVLKAMGLPDEKLQAVWGKEIWESNAQKKMAPSAAKWLEALKNPTPDIEAAPTVEDAAEIAVGNDPAVDTPEDVLQKAADDNPYSRIARRYMRSLK